MNEKDIGLQYHFYLNNFLNASPPFEGSLTYLWTKTRTQRRAIFAHKIGAHTAGNWTHSLCEPSIPSINAVHQASNGVSITGSTEVICLYSIYLWPGKLASTPSFKFIASSYKNNEIQGKFYPNFTQPGTILIIDVKILECKWKAHSRS